MKSQLQYNRYLKFIDSLKGQTVNGYCEVHHIVPKSLGGTDDKDNLIKLTARQHYVAHWILARALGGSAARAFFMMSNFGRYGKVNSKTYDIARAEYSKLASEQMQGRTMPPVSDATREKQRQAKLGRKLSPEHIEKVRQASTGRVVSEETKRKVSEAKKGKGNGRTGYKQTEATKQKIIQANFNRPIIQCPHCLKTMKDHGGAKRWHFSNCREQRKAA